MTATEIDRSMDAALSELHRRQGRPSFVLLDGHRFARARSWGWVLFVVTNGSPRKVGTTRSEQGFRSFLRGGVW